MKECPVSPISLASPDWSTHENEAFGIPIKSDAQLLRDLSPPGVTSDVQQDLAATMVDVTSLPGKFSALTEQDTQWESVAMALTELALVKQQTEAPDRVRQDLSWNSRGRNGLTGILSQKILLDRTEEVETAIAEVTETMYNTMAVVLSRTHWDTDSVENWSRLNYFSRLTEDTISNYRSLLQHVTR